MSRALTSPSQQYECSSFKPHPFSGPHTLPSLHLHRVSRGDFLFPKGLRGRSPQRAEAPVSLPALVTPPVRCGRRPLSAALRAWPQVAAAFRQHDLTSWFPRITRCLPSAAPGLAAAGWGGCRRLWGCPWGLSGSGLPSPIAPEHRLPRAGAGWVAQPLSVLREGVWGGG